MFAAGDAALLILPVGAGEFRRQGVTMLHTLGRVVTYTGTSQFLLLLESEPKKLESLQLLLRTGVSALSLLIFHTFLNHVEYLS